MIEHLLKPGKMGNLTLKNRVTYSSMAFQLKHTTGQLFESEIESLAYRAKQEFGPGLINFPGAITSAPTKAGHNGHICIYNDETMLSLSRAVKRVKVNDCKVMIQCGGGARFSDCGPSDLPNNNTGTPTRGMTTGEIAGYIEEVAKAARLSAEAGFDALEVHSSTGKLLSAFLSPYSNHRTDQYGGSTYNRARLIIEMLEAMRREVHDNVAISIKLSVSDMVGYLSIEDGKEIAKHIAPYVDAIQPSAGFNEFKWTVTPAYFYKKGFLLDYTEAIKEVVDVPVVAMGKLGDPATAERVLAEGKADFVCLGRPLYADPAWLTKAAHGESHKILQCLSCVNCFTPQSRKEIFPPHRACTINPTLLREESFCNLEPAETKQKVLVVGGGLGGMEAAATLAKRGHDVTLCEKTDNLGGQWIVASKEKEKVEYRTIIPYQKREMEEAGVNIVMNTTVDEQYIENFAPDAVVLATGAQPRNLPVNNPNVKFNVVQGNDVLMDNAQVGDRVVVVGGRFIGMETAVKLVNEGKHVSLVDMQELGKGANPRISGVYRNRMVEGGVYLYPSCPIRRFTDEGLEITHMNLPLTLPADTVVLAIGTVPTRDLQKVLEARNIRHFLVGDCKRIGDALLAIRDGAEIGRLI